MEEDLTPRRVCQNCVHFQREEGQDGTCRRVAPFALVAWSDWCSQFVDVAREVTRDA